jgi:hypothetical protein
MQWLVYITIKFLEHIKNIGKLVFNWNLNSNFIENTFFLQLLLKIF